METHLFDFDDILLEPTVLSEISSRKEINLYYDNKLPLMTAPMNTVIDEKNFHLFEKHGITAILPRIPNITNNHYSFDRFMSYSLTDFEMIFLVDKINVPHEKKVYALIDVANGHMEKLFNLAKKAKEEYGDSMCLMIGNVANPETFLKYANINVDYIRIGIGNGGGCLTTVQTGVGYPMASLIEKCNWYKKQSKIYGNTKTLIVADGGFKKYSDVIKALALGADYVMLGSIFNKALESAGETIRDTSTIDDRGFAVGQIIDQYSEEALNMFNADITLRKTFRGMSTKDVQKIWGKETFTTSEGVVKSHKVEYTLEGWVNNFTDYLRSAMSYCGKKELHQFIGGAKYNLITQNSFNRYNK